MPYGVVNGPATFQDYIIFFLQDYLDIPYITNLDHILIYSLNPKTYKDDVSCILKQLLKQSVSVNLPIYILGVLKLDFLTLYLLPKVFR